MHPVSLRLRHVLRLAFVLICVLVGSITTSPAQASAHVSAHGVTPAPKPSAQNVHPFDTPPLDANLVYGQKNFTTVAPVNAPTAFTLNDPVEIKLDSHGGLYVADTYNNRVLYYPVGSTTATRVYGQPGFTSNCRTENCISPSATTTATSLTIPTSVAITANDDVFIADLGNARVLHYPAGSTTPDRVYGQPDFVSSTSNNGGVSASSLNDPNDVAVTDSGDLYVADAFNNRVLYYPAGSTTASRVYGQPDFVSSTANNGGISATSLASPWGFALDATGNLYISDFGNNRILYYPANQKTATRVYGQPDFTSNTINNGGLSAQSLSAPTGLAVANGGDLFATDTFNNRALYYPAGC